MSKITRSENSQDNFTGIMFKHGETTGNRVVIEGIVLYKNVPIYYIPKMDIKLGPFMEKPLEVLTTLANELGIC